MPDENRGHPAVNTDIINAVCIDLDDLSTAWAELGRTLKRVQYLAEAETEGVLQQLDELGIIATFFIPGACLHYAPGLVQAIAAAGHEVASHGTLHILAASHGPQAFRADILASKSRLEDAIGREVTAFKAPSWGIGPEDLWAYDVLIEEGFLIDNSAMPRLKVALGVAPYENRPLLYKGSLLVVPPTSLRLAGNIGIPMPGGFYSKYVPAALLATMFGRINAGGLPFNYYFHPFEHSPVGENRKTLKYGNLFASLYAANLGTHARQLRHLAKSFHLARLSDAYRFFLPSVISQD